MSQTRLLYLRAASFLIILPVLLLAQVQRPFTFPHTSQSSPQSQAAMPRMPFVPHLGPKGQLGRRGVQAFDSTASSIFLEAPEYSSGIVVDSIVVADVNGDGFPDLIVADKCYSSRNCSNGGVSVALGNGDGTFQAPVTYSSGGYGADSIAVGDVNGDGKPDLLVANQGGESNGDGSVAVLLGNGDGTFQAAVSNDSGGTFAASIAVADVNGDGKPDLLVANNCVNGSSSDCDYGADPGEVGVLLGNGDGTFQAAVSYNSGGADAVSIAVADVNGDGKLDLLVANYNPGSVGVLLGNGDGTFQAAVSYSSGYYPVSIAVADVNGDGKPDLVVANQCVDANCDGTVGVLLGNGNGTFQAAVSYSSGGSDANSIAVGDVNGDGKPDLLVANQCASSVAGQCQSGVDGVVSVLFGNGDGTFQAPVSYNSGGYPANSIAVADVNSDGKLDLLVANALASGTYQENGGGVGVLLGNGNGTFQAARSYSSGGADASWVAVADVNGDGKPDLLVANWCVDGLCDDNFAGTVGVLLGNGDGTFQAAVSYNSGGEEAESIAVADVNGDGKPDLLVANVCSGSGNCSNGVVVVLLGNGDGTFQAPVSYNSGGYEPLSIAVADVNGDGKPDLLVANYWASSSNSNGVVAVLLGNGDGTFQAPVSYNSGGEAESIAVVDVNGDGKPDLLVANYSPGSVGVLLGNGDGTFQAPVSYNSGGYEALSIAVTDVNGDGFPDLIVANQYASPLKLANGSVGVLLGNGDGTFQAAVMTETPGPLNGRQIAVADFNGDGKLDAAIGSGAVLLLGNGDGTFQTPLALGVAGVGTAVGDFNGDGKPDLAVGGVTILLNISPVFAQAQTITFTQPAPASAVYGSSFTVAATGGGSGNPVTFTSSGSCSNAGATYTMTSGTGTCSVIANQAGNSNYLAAPTVTESVNATPATQTITFTQPAPASAVYGSSFTVAATGGGSGNPVTFTSSGSCSNAGATYTMTSGTGTCSVIANQAGNSTYSAAPQVTETVNATPVSQAITFITPPPPTSKSGDTFTVAASGGASGNPVTFSVGAGSVCTLSGATYTMTSDTGFCYVVANQAGNNNYSAAPQVTDTVTAVKTVVKIAPTVTFTGAPASAAYLSTFTVATTQNSGITPTITSSTGSVCSVSGGIVTMKKGTGTCTVKASWAADAYYLATSLTQSVTATLLGTTTTITNMVPGNNPLKVAVYFAVSNGTSKAVTGNVKVTAASGQTCTGIVAIGKCVLTFTTPESTTITATYAGNTNDRASTSASYPLTVN